MRKFFFVAAFFTVFAFTARPQEIYFCEGIGDNGQPVNPSSLFRIDKKGGYFYFLVKLPFEINCTQVDFKLYSIGSGGSLTYETTISTDTQNDWTWFWKKVTFYLPGSYQINAVDCNGEVIVSGTVDIEFK